MQYPQLYFLYHFVDINKMIRTSIRISFNALGNFQNLSFLPLNNTGLNNTRMSNPASPNIYRIQKFYPYEMENTNNFGINGEHYLVVGILFSSIAGGREKT